MYCHLKRCGGHTDVNGHLGLRRLRTSCLLALLLAACVAAQPAHQSASPSSGSKQYAGFDDLLRYATYALMVCSTGLLLVSGAALLKMPKPRFLCYRTDYSDAASCNGSPCCACANIRQASNAMFLVWGLLLMCRLAIGLNATFLYPFIGFCSLHIVTALAVHMMLRGYSQATTSLGQAGAHQPGAAQAHTGSASAPPPPIQTMSAELVLIVQPDYSCCGAEEASRQGAEAGGPSCGDVDGDRPSGPAKGLSWGLHYTRLGTPPVLRQPTTPTLPEGEVYEELGSSARAREGAAGDAGMTAAAGAAGGRSAQTPAYVGGRLLRSRTYSAPQRDLDAPLLGWEASGSNAAGGGGGGRRAPGGAVATRSSSCALPLTDVVVSSALTQGDEQRLLLGGAPAQHSAPPHRSAEPAALRASRSEAAVLGAVAAAGTAQGTALPRARSAAGAQGLGLPRAETPRDSYG